MKYDQHQLHPPSVKPPCLAHFNARVACRSPRGMLDPSYRTYISFVQTLAKEKRKFHLPSRQLRMVPLSIPISSIRMYQRRKRSPVDHQPRNKSSELQRCEDIHFKHGDWMWTYGFVPELVDSKLGNCQICSSVGASSPLSCHVLESSRQHTLSSHSFVQLCSEFGLHRITLKVVDVDVEPSS